MSVLLLLPSESLKQLWFSMDNWHFLSARGCHLNPFFAQDVSAYKYKNDRKDGTSGTLLT
jgi:hypothetical protein